MNRTYIIAALALLAVGCSKQDSFQDSFVKETYIHQYGVTVSKREWKDRGSSGVIISTNRDGITSSRSFRNGILHGDTTISFPHSDVTEKTESYNNGKLVKLTLHYRNGMPRQEDVLLGEQEKTRTTWYETGAPASVEQHVGEQLVAGEYLNLQNEVVSKVIDGEGKRTRWDSYGELIAVDQIDNGLMVASTEFHHNGTPKAIIPFVNGKIHGQKRTFFPAGEPKTVETWVHGQRTGTTVVFQNGEKESEVPYVKGKKHGVEKRFGSDNTVAEEITWSMDKRHGPTRVFVDRSRKTDWYFQGRLVSKAAYDDLSGPGPGSSRRPV